ncbi:hypothetical protein CKO31_23870 [Thiohalocapsa halophila]|uniref:Ammonium transporter AmtB-like domain-containing protein n=1 Tax=Thiohalocapsa halophila TaxID=69359 RepID=A0ABS1CP58_9GAMM|nr:hypothetical protein [Thiohalocapsa halophila]
MPGRALAGCLLLVMLLPLPAGFAQAPTADASAAGDNGGAGGEGAAAPATPSPEELLASLQQQLDGLDQGLKTLEEQIALNREEIAGQSERLDAEMKRMDPIAVRLDSLSQRLEQTQKMLEEHETRIEDNSVRLFETLMGIDDTEQSVAALRAQLQRLERNVQARAAREADDRPGAGAAAGAPDARQEGGAALLPFALGLLLPAGILLYPAARARRAQPSRGPPAASTPPGTLESGAGNAAPAAGLLLALTGAVLGFALVGIGIRDGASLGGILGAPFAFLPQLLALSPEARLPVVAEPLLARLPLVAAMALLAAVTVGSRLTALGGLLVGLAVGALLLPLFGHWSGAGAASGDPAPGWLAGLGFTDTGAVAGTALVGGGAALGLAFGMGRARAGPPRERLAGGLGREPALPVVAVLLIWIGWLEPRIAATPEAGVALVLASWAAAAGALLVATLFSALLRGDAERWDGLPAALLAGILAAPAAAASGLAVPLIFGALVALLHGLLARALQGGDTHRELAAAFAVAGLAAALAPALVGPDGFLFAPVAEDLPVQALGAGVALVVGVGGGLCLGLLLRLLPGLLSRRPADAVTERAPQAAAATAA